MSTLDPRALEAALHAVEGEGLTSDGGTPHGWRCEHPDRYPDHCKCPIEMADAAIRAALPHLTAEDVPHLIRQAKAEAWEDGRAVGLFDQSASMRAGRPLRSPNPYAEEEA